MDAVTPNREAIRKRIKELNQARLELLSECILDARGGDPLVFIQKSVPQSQLFMVEVIPWIHKLYFSEATNAEKSVLDIGPQSFGGTALLSSIHSRQTHNKLKLDVTAIDFTDQWELIREMIAPEVEFIHGDIFKVENRTWDMVICSHVIEHVPDPFPFLRRRQDLANDWVIVACPWQESAPLTDGHVNVIDKAFVRRAGAVELQVYTNYMWGKQREVCIFLLKGRANPKRQAEA